jgi:hypothetical protein
LTAPVSGRILRGTINRKALEDVQRRFTYLLFVAVVSSVASAPISAQLRTDSPPAYKAPRTADGKPDLQGVWQALNTAAWDIQDHAAGLGVPAGQSVVEGNEIPYQPWAAARKKDNFEKRLTEDPIREVLSAGRAAHHVHAAPISNLSDARDHGDPLRVRPRRANDLYGSTAPPRPH